MRKKRPEVDPIRENVTLDEVMKGINKRFGEKTMILGSQRPKDPPRLPFGIFAADFCVGGGLPIWQTVCGWGADSSGKTLLGIKAMRSASLICWRCFKPKTYCKCPEKPLSMKSVYLGAEGMLDKAWVKDCGVEPDQYIETNCDFGEQYIDVADEALKSQECGLVIFDSLAALVPEAEMEASASDQFMGRQAAMIGRAVRRLKTRLLMEMKRNHPCTIYFVNQMRCVPKDTIICENGRLAEISFVEIGGKIITSSSGVGIVEAVNDPGEVHGVSLFLKGRGALRISNNHLQPVLGGVDGLFEKLGKRVTVGDWIPSPILDGNHLDNTAPFIDLRDIVESVTRSLPLNAKRIKLPLELDDVFGLFLGCYYADGSILEQDGTYHVSFTEKDKERFSIVRELCRKLFPGNFSANSKWGTIVVGGMCVTRFLKSLRVGANGSEKRVPPLVIRSRKSVIRNFLRGASFDTHRFCDDKTFIFTNETRKGAEQVAILLYHFGVFADLRRDRKGEYRWLFISGEDALMFKSRIGFSEPKKQSHTFNGSQTARGKHDVVPNWFAAYVFDLVSKKVMGISKLPYYNQLKMSLYKKLNAGRNGAHSFVKGALEKSGKDEKLAGLANLLGCNRFAEVERKDSTIFDGMDIEVENGLFVAGNVLTHNSKIGVMFGSPDTMSGGWAMRHEFSILLRLVKKSLAKGKEGKKGSDDIYFDGERAKEQASRHSFEIKKEKVLTLAGSGEFVIIKENLVGLGLKKGMVDDFNTMMHMAQEYEVVKKDGNGWKYLTFSAKTHDDIKKVWRENPSEYIRCTQEIVKRAKDRLRGE